MSAHGHRVHDSGLGVGHWGVFGVMRVMIGPACRRGHGDGVDGREGVILAWVVCSGKGRRASGGDRDVEQLRPWGCMPHGVIGCVVIRGKMAACDGKEKKRL